MTAPAAIAPATIFAQASGQGRAGVAVLRLSGPGAGPALDALARGRPTPRRASLRRLYDPSDRDGAPLDEALVLWFPAPASFTGEDCAELHLHGGPAVIAAVSDALVALGLRPAAPGDFARRAFEHGKLDLTQAEAIADLVDAETEAQRAQALAQLRGDLGALYDGWRARLIEAMALLEAAIDFPDEGDVSDGLAGAEGRVHALLDALAADIAAHLSDARRGEAVREGFHIALIGAPNAGKSSVLNALAGREAAIVTDIPGTTRDVVEARLVVDGFLVILADTAGLRATDDPVEREGVRRARARAEDADLRVLVVDAADPMAALAAHTAAQAPRLRPDDLVFVNKTDIGPAAPARAAAAAETGLDAPAILTGAARTGDGLAALTTQISARVRARLGGAAALSLTRARHRAALERALGAVSDARARASDAPELAGESARAAAQALGEITGRVDVEDILDRVFADFCIGK